MGGLSYGLLEGCNYRLFGLFAHAWAAICCTEVGAHAIGRRDDVLTLIKGQRPGEAAASSAGLTSVVARVDK